MTVVLAKNSKCIEMIGKNTKGSSNTKSRNGRVNSAPPKPIPERTKPLQAKNKCDSRKLNKAEFGH